jgi:nicotinamide phosphoribosyltransferase
MSNTLSEELLNFLMLSDRIPTPLQTDGYKLGHHYMYMGGTLNLMSYDEARLGAKYDKSLIIGQQPLIKKHLIGRRINSIHEVKMCHEFCREYFMGHDYFNFDMWKRIYTHHDGKLPLRIKSIQEGVMLPISNAISTIEATDNTIDPKTGKGYFVPLINHFETIFTHVWGPQNVGTLAKYIYDTMKDYFDETVDDDMHVLLPYMMHDFGYRGVMCDEQGGVAGSGFLPVFQGTDTLRAIYEVIKYYGTNKMPGFSVAASEHSVMTQKTESGEYSVIEHIVRNTPEGAILSIVNDSYDCVRFVTEYLPRLEPLIKERGIKFVVRPDSPRFKNDNPEDQVLWLNNQLAKQFGTTANKKGYLVVNPNFGTIYGDGIGPRDILNCLETLKMGGFAASSCVYGMGGGLLQKHNRDTQRKAFKCCARETEEGWSDVYKKPLDSSKASKAGRLAVVKHNTKGYETIREEDLNGRKNELELTFENGELIRDMTWEQVCNNVHAV